MKAQITELKTLPEAGSTRTHGRLFVHFAPDSILQHNVEDFQALKFFKSALPEILERLELDIDPKLIKFSQRAGCSCGCSPGFIIPNLGPVNVWADVKEVEA